MKQVMFFRPTLADGGADRVQLALLNHLDRGRFSSTLVLVRAEGPLLADVPADVRVIDLGRRRLALSGAALHRVLRAERPDVLFCTCSASNVVASAVHGAARCRARLVLSERNALYRGRSARHVKQSIEVALKKVTYERADVVTAVSQGVADEMRDTLRLSSDKIEVVYNPMVGDDVAERAAAPVDHPWFHDGKPVVLAVGRLVAQKDYPTLLKAFWRVRQRVDCRLFVLGIGPLRRELEAQVLRMGLAGAVHFAGFDKNPLKYMARARALMHASRAEGLPGSLIQTMACGTPVVSTDCDFGPREIISAPERDGFLVPVGDAAALAYHAIRLLEDPALRNAVGAAAAASAQRFSVSESLRRYQEAMGG